jgi:C-terminal processing protease CtpA/Prc
LATLAAIAPLAAAAQQDRAEDGLPPAVIHGTYSTSYYAGFADWDIFPVLLPMVNATPTVLYQDRFDLTEEGQIIGRLDGEVAEGQYRIELPPSPTRSAWFETDGDPDTPSAVKVFIVGTGTGMIGTEFVSRYDFIYTRSYAFDPVTHLWDGNLLVWAAADGASFPVLSGPDRTFYTEDDLQVTVPAGWSVVEVKATPNLGIESVRVYHTSQPEIELHEPPYLRNVNLTDLTYELAFSELMSELQRTYAFTDFREVDWDFLAEFYTPKAAEVTSDAEFQQLLESALFTFRDGHLAILGPGLPAWMYGRLGLQVYPVNDQLMVIDVIGVSPATESEIIPGTIITAVNSENAIDYFNQVPRSVYSGGHEAQDIWFRGGLAFRAEPGTAFELTYVLPDGTEGKATLTTEELTNVYNVRAEEPGGPVHHEILPSGMGLIRILNFTSSMVDNLWDEAMQSMIENRVPGIIIDLRDNGGGFSSLTNYMLGDFLDSDVYSGREISAVDEDGDGIADIQEEYYFARGAIFNASDVIVMVGPDCFSACEFAALGFQDLGATVIGYLPSGGAGGGVGASYLLPGNTRIYGMAVVRQEDPEGNVVIEGTGVQLDLQVPFTPMGLASGDDVVLMAAEQYLLSK